MSKKITPKQEDLPLADSNDESSHSTAEISATHDSPSTESSPIEQDITHGQKPPSISDENRIKGPDRRKRPTPFVSRYTFFGRRQANRRDIDPTKNFYVDKLGRNYIAVVAVIFILSVADSLFTLYHLERGGFREVNPLLNAFLFNNVYFLVVKYALTVVGITALCLHKFFSGVTALIGILIAGYVMLNIYQVWLL